MDRLDHYGVDLVEVVYESTDSRVVALESEPATGFPATVVRDGHLFHYTGLEIVSRSGESTHDRVRYRQHPFTPTTW